MIGIEELYEDNKVLIELIEKYKDIRCVDLECMRINELLCSECIMCFIRTQRRGQCLKKE